MSVPVSSVTGNSLIFFSLHRRRAACSSSPPRTCLQGMVAKRSTDALSTAAGSSPRVSTRRRSPSVKMPSSFRAASISTTLPARAEVMARRQSTTGVVGATAGTRSPARIASAQVISLRPSAPPGWKRAYCSGVNFRWRCTVSARASPRASIAVVLALGAKPRGQASVMRPIDSAAAAWRARGELVSPTTAISGAPMWVSEGSKATSSSLAPELLKASTTSWAWTMPRSP